MTWELDIDGPSPFQMALGRSKRSPASLLLNGMAPAIDVVAKKRALRPFFGAWLEDTGGSVLGVRSSDHCAGLDSMQPSNPKLVLHTPIGPHHNPISDRVAGSFHFGAACSERDLDVQLFVAAEMGLDGLCCPVAGADVPAVQFVTEVARELRMSALWMVESESDLRTLLETDAPYFGFVASHRSDSHEPRFPFSPCKFSELRSMLPPEAKAVCFYCAPETDVQSFMMRIAACGFHAYVGLN